MHGRIPFLESDGEFASGLEPMARGCRRGHVFLIQQYGAGVCGVGADRF
jgi:hypothetical protein